MMIAKWINDTVKLQIVTPVSSFFPALSPQFQGQRLAAAMRRVMPKKRDREVPYGMKGGEH